jgi:hypothetical protein
LFGGKKTSFSDTQYFSAVLGSSQKVSPEKPWIDDELPTKRAG